MINTGLSLISTCKLIRLNENPQTSVQQVFYIRKGEGVPLSSYKDLIQLKHLLDGNIFRYSIVQWSSKSYSEDFVSAFRGWGEDPSELQ